MVKAMDPRRWPYLVSPSPNAVETARKRASLLTDVVSHLARYQIALKALADFERRQESQERAADLKAAYHSLDSTKQQFGIDEPALPR